MRAAAAALRPALTRRPHHLLPAGWGPDHAPAASVRTALCRRAWLHEAAVVRARAPPPSPPPPPPAPASAAAAAAAAYRDQNDTWVDRSCPAAVAPYLKLARVDRPVGTYLVLAPGLWGLALAAPPGGLPAASLVALFAAGAFLMRGAGCTINDIWDRDVDGAVARTARRPLATGAVTPLQAWAFLGAQLAAGLGVLLQLPWPTVLAGAAIVPVVVVYPLMKRVTHWPQAALGVAMNYGVVMGWSATHGGAVDVGAVGALYAGAVAWTVVYDTLYAHQDKHDDARLGLRSTALLMGDASRTVLTGFALGAGALWAAAGDANALAWPYGVAVGGATAHMLWQVRTADYGDRASLARRFVSNHWVGWMMLAGLVGGKLLMPQGGEGAGAGEAAVVAAAEGGAEELR